MNDFLTSSLKREGAGTMITPREIIRDFVTLLDLLYTNPAASYADIKKTAVVSDIQAAPAVQEISSSQTPPQTPAGNSVSQPRRVTLEDISF